MHKHDLEHFPVMCEEVLEYLAPQEGDVILDGTVGGAGHGSVILQKIGPNGYYWGIERDPRTLDYARERLAQVGHPFSLIHGNFADLDSLAKAYAIAPVDLVLLDLGTSMFQLKEAERGFSLREDGPLDMRMNPHTGETAADWVNSRSEQTLKDMFRELGDERFAGRIARAIVESRRQVAFTRTRELTTLIERVVPRKGKIHPATRVFQALRIAVNDEYKALEQVIPAAVEILKPGGKIAVISFHSGEDRRVKQAFRLMSQDCICPPRQPICTCDHKAILERSGKAIKPSEQEVKLNPPSRSARLRVAKKCLLA